MKRRNSDRIYPRREFLAAAAGFGLRRAADAAKPVTPTRRHTKYK